MEDDPGADRRLLSLRGFLGCRPLWDRLGELIMGSASLRFRVVCSRTTGDCYSGSPTGTSPRRPSKMLETGPLVFVTAALSWLLSSPLGVLLYVLKCFESFASKYTRLHRSGPSCTRSHQLATCAKSAAPGGSELSPHLSDKALLVRDDVHKSMNSCPCH